MMTCDVSPVAMFFFSKTEFWASFGFWVLEELSPHFSQIVECFNFVGIKHCLMLYFPLFNEKILKDCL